MVALVLQGGGALGAYHIGCCEALEEAGYAPDWVSGISIGAINAAVIAGNEPGERISRLETLWNDISRDDAWGGWLTGGLRRLFNMGSAGEALLLGQPNFFTPRIPSPLLAPPGSPGATSFYDTSPLRATLLRLADFDRINRGATRLSLGATKVTTGELVFFDNRRGRIGPEHVMASGSLPPGFPAVEADGELYWDGGCVSNTPLEAVLDDRPGGDVLVFMIDLWDAHGALPRTMDEVLWRQKQIQYASRTRQHIETVKAKLDLEKATRRLRRRGAAELADAAVADDMIEHVGHVDIVHVTYRPGADQVSQSDAEFSRASIADRRAAGLADMRKALAKAPWTGRERAENEAATIHRVAAGETEKLRRAA
jgi:NTE family protein